MTSYSLIYPLKNQIYEKISLERQIVDVTLLNDLNKEGWNISMKDLNKALLHLEIMGLIVVSWIGKDKRRIEPRNKDVEEESQT